MRRRTSRRAVHMSPGYTYGSQPFKQANDLFDMKQIEDDFHRTSSPYQGGYLMPEGDYIDFSSQGAGGQSRGDDHRIIVGYIKKSMLDKKTKDEIEQSRYKGVDLFLRETGAIRFNASTTSKDIDIDYRGRLTSAQMNEIRKAWDDVGRGYINVDIESDDCLGKRRFVSFEDFKRFHDNGNKK